MEHRQTVKNERQTQEKSEREEKEADKSMEQRQTVKNERQTQEKRDGEKRQEWEKGSRQDQAEK